MSIKNFLKIIEKFAKRNRINLSDTHLPIKPSTVHLHWWKIEGEKQNVGDMLSLLLFLSM